MQNTILNSNNNTQIGRLTFNSIAGYKEEKDEALKIINLFKNYDKLKELGISIPRGLILSGFPGVGKTLMAKVIASEADVPIYVFKNSDDEGTVDKLYEEARKNAPSIVFIDELDKLTATNEFVSDDSRIILRHLLSILDGMGSNDGVMTIATTNYYESLPEALKRSGRMDKHIHFDLPDTESREAILNLYLNDKENIVDCDIRDIAIKTKNMSGADLKTLVNETLLEMVSSGKEKSLTKDFLRQIPLISLKGIRKKSIENQDYVIYHELGHLILEYKLNNNYSSISIERIGNIQGYISPVERKMADRKVFSSKTLRNKCIVALGGYAAERIFLNETYDGVSSDFQKFSYLSERMAQSGMFGVDYIFGLSGGRTIREDRRDTSEKIENIQKEFFHECLDIANEIIAENRDLIDFMFNKIKEFKTLDSGEVEGFIKEFNDKHSIEA